MTSVIERYEQEIKQLSPTERLELATLILNSLTQAPAELPGAERPARRPAGLAEGLFVVPADFNDPLPDDVLDAFEGR